MFYGKIIQAQHFGRTFQSLEASLINYIFTLCHRVRWRISESWIIMWFHFSYGWVKVYFRGRLSKDSNASWPWHSETSIPSLLHSEEKTFFTQNSFKRSIGREEHRRVEAAAKVEKGNCQLNSHKAYIGLFRSRVFPGWRFFGWELVRFQPWVLTNSEIGWISFSGIG